MGSKSFLNEKCKLLNLNKINDSRGNLSYIQSQIDIPFEIKRVYYLYDVPGGADRGGHAHKNLQQLIIAIAGSFDIVLFDGVKSKKIHLNRANTGLFIDAMIWRTISNFSTGSICLVLASEYFDEEDYYRDISEFKKATNG